MKARNAIGRLILWFMREVPTQVQQRGDGAAHRLANRNTLSALATGWKQLRQVIATLESRMDALEASDRDRTAKWMATAEGATQLQREVRAFEGMQRGLEGHVTLIEQRLAAVERKRGK